MKKTLKNRSVIRVTVWLQVTSQGHYVGRITVSLKGTHIGAKLVVDVLEQLRLASISSN